MQNILVCGWRHVQQITYTYLTTYLLTDAHMFHRLMLYWTELNSLQGHVYKKGHIFIKICI